MTLRPSIAAWLRADPVRHSALEQAASLALPDWCVAAGFVRNLVWDKLHGYSRATPLADVDLIYFDPTDASASRDALLQEALNAESALNWSVKNQARMHHRNGDAPYTSTEDAMRHWVEIETAVGARLSRAREIEVLAPFGLGALAALTVTLNPARPKPADFAARLTQKKWLETWPELRVVGAHHEE